MIINDVQVSKNKAMDFASVSELETFIAALKAERDAIAAGAYLDAAKHGYNVFECACGHVWETGVPAGEQWHFHILARTPADALRTLKQHEKEAKEVTWEHVFQGIEEPCGCENRRRLFRALELEKAKAVLREHREYCRVCLEIVGSECWREAELLATVARLKAESAKEQK